MGGVSKTISTGMSGAKQVFSGKGNMTDFARAITGMSIGDRSGPPPPYDPNADPFAFNIEQSMADTDAINTLGKKQYDETISEVPKVVQNAVLQQLPGIQEKLNSQHLLNSTALQQEIGRQQEALTQNLVMPARQTLQSFQTGALQRGLSLEDFTKQAQIARTLGSQQVPQVGNGKGSAVAGLGAGATAGTAVMPGFGTAIGAGLGYLAGGGAGGGKGK